MITTEISGRDYARGFAAASHAAMRRDFPAFND
jgi:hypothetical protein